MLWLKWAASKIGEYLCFFLAIACVAFVVRRDPSAIETAWIMLAAFVFVFCWYLLARGKE